MRRLRRMRPGHWAAAALAGATLLAVACRDQSPPTTGGIVLVLISTPPAVSVAGVGGAPAQPPIPVAFDASAAQFTNVHVIVAGPTPRDLNLTREGDNWTATIDGLEPGTYTVTIEGLEGSALTYYGQNTNVTVVAGENRATPVPFNPARPAMTPPASPTTAMRFPVAFQPVTGATSYRIEWSTDAGFAGAADTTVTGSPATIAVRALGTYHVRGIATIGSRTGGPSDPVTADVVSDRDSTGATTATAAPLGFGTAINGTLQQLNIAPASDEDWFAFTACAADTLRVETRASRLNPVSDLNTFLRLFAADGVTQIAADDDGAGGTDSRIQQVIPADGGYRLQVTGTLATVGHYQLQLTLAPGPNVVGTTCQLPVDTLLVTPAVATLRALTATTTLTATALNATGDTLTGATISWTSDNPSVASVDPSTGVVTAVAPGTATISAAVVGGAPPAQPDVAVETDTGTAPEGRPAPDLESGDPEPESRPGPSAIPAGSAAITVIQAPASIQVTPTPDTLRFITDTTQLAAVALDSLGSPIPGAVFTWSSTDSAIVTVDPAGLAAAAGAGEATVSATFDTTQGGAVLRVIQDPKSLVVVAGDGQTGFASNTLPVPLAARVLDSAGFGVQGVSVAWAVTGGGGSVSTPSSLTNANGTATVSWTLGAAAGAQTAEATLLAFTAPFGASAIVGIEWINAAGGNWSVPGNWSTNAVPTASDTVLIGLDGNYTVTVDVPSQAAHLTLGHGPGTVTGQTLFLASTLGVGSKLLVAQGGSVAVGASTLNVDTLRIIGGDVNLDGGTVNAAAILNGNVFLASPNGGTADVTQTFRNNGTVQVQAGGTLSVVTGAWTQTVAGALALELGATLDLTLASATFQAGLSVDSARSVVADGAAMAVTGVLDVLPFGFLGLLNSTLTVDSLHNAGDLTLDNSSINGGLANLGYLGVFSGSNTLTGPITTGAGSAIEVNGIGTALHVNSPFTNEGTLTLTGIPAGLGDVQFDAVGTGLLVNNGSIDLTGVPGTLFVDSLVNNGTISANTVQCCAVVVGGVRNASPGYIGVDAGGMTVTTGRNEGFVEFLADDTLSTTAGAFANLAGGTVTGTGTIAGAAGATNTGTLEPGPTGGYGQLRILGGLALGPTSVVGFDLDGTTPAVDMDRLTVVGGALSIDGAIDVTPSIGFVYTYGNTHEIIGFDGSAGAWADTSALEIASQHALRSQYGATSYRLRVAAPFIDVTPDVDTLTTLGDTVHLNALGRGFDASTFAVTVTWTAEDSAVTTVDPATGIAAAKAPGTTNVFASDAGGTAGVTALTVAAAPVATVAITPTSGAPANVSVVTPFTAEVRDATNTVVPFPVSWTTGNTGVATAAADGNVTSTGPGQTFVRAQADTAVDFATITVAQPGLAPANVWWSPSSVGAGGLAAIWASGAADVWAVGASGAVYRWNGASWGVVNIGAGVLNLTAVGGSGPDDIYVGAGTGEVFHFDGTIWAQLPAQAGGGVADIWAGSPRDVWIALPAGQVNHWDGSAWNLQATTTAENLLAIWGSSRNDVFAAGANGAIVHYNGAVWAGQASGTTRNIRDLWGTANDRVWGAANTDTILFYNGTVWTPAQTGGGASFGSVTGYHETDVYVAGDNGGVGHVWHWDGISWSPIIDGSNFNPGPLMTAATPGTVMAVNAFGADVRGHQGGYVLTDPDTVLAAGTKILSATAFDALGTPVGAGILWSTLTPGVATVNPGTGEVSGVSGGAAQIVATAVGGAADTAEIWVQVPTAIAVTPGGGSIADVGLTTGFVATVLDQVGAVISGAAVTWSAANTNVAMIDATGTAVGVGDGQTIIQASFQGAVGHAVLTVAAQGATPVNLWGEMVNPTFGSGQIWRIRSSGDGEEAFAFGQMGLLRFDGASWIDLARPGSRPFYGGWIGSSTNVWATSDQGMVYNWNGATWDSMSTGAPGSLYAFWASSPTDMWAAGDGPNLYHYDGVSWSPVAFTHGYVWELWGTDSANVFGAGGQATMLRFDGTTWANETSPFTSHRGVWGPGGDSVFVAAPVSNGVGLRSAGAWAAMTSPPLTSMGIWGSSSSEVYAALIGGGVGYFDGANWAVHTLLPNASLVWSVSGTHDGRVYAVSSTGRIYQGVRGGNVAFTLPDSIFPGDTLRNTVLTARNALGVIVDSVRYVWSSGNTAIATVLAGGAGVVAQDTGTVQIIATAGGGAADTALLRVGLKSARVLLLADDDAELGYTMNQFSPNMPGITFDTMNTASQTPSLAFLQTFDVVLVWRDGSPLSPVAVGDTLAAFVAGGGNMVFSQFYWFTPNMFGANLAALQPLVDPVGGSTEFNADSILPGGITSHPLTRGIDTIRVSNWHGGVVTTGSETVVATWSDGAPAIAYRILGGNQRMVAVTAFTATGLLGQTFGDETWYRMWENAIRWASDGGNSALPAPPFSLAGGIPRGWPVAAADDLPEPGAAGPVSGTR